MQIITNRNLDLAKRVMYSIIIKTKVNVTQFYDCEEYYKT